MVVFIELISLISAIFILYVLYSFVKNPVAVLANTAVGVIIFLVLNLTLVRDVSINLFSVGTVAIAGIPGVVLVLVIHFLGLGF